MTMLDLCDDWLSSYSVKLKNLTLFNSGEHANSSPDDLVQLDRDNAGTLLLEEPTPEAFRTWTSNHG